MFDFNKNTNVNDWRIVDDVVMGGMSNGNFSLDTNGIGVFQGSISLENYGGFSSVRHRFEKAEVAKHTKFVIRLKGDGKNYQFRIKANAYDRYSYIKSFSTTGKWENIEINLNDMYPSFRGRKLNKPNFSSSHIEEMTFLIANKKKENFKLMLDKIELK